VPEPDAAAEDQRRGKPTERDTEARSDPAAVDREHEEEDDAEQRDDATGERQGFRAEEIRQ
jgi:hypothetical protein